MRDAEIGLLVGLALAGGGATLALRGRALDGNAAWVTLACGAALGIVLAVALVSHVERVVLLPLESGYVSGEDTFFRATGGALVVLALGMAVGLASAFDAREVARAFGSALLLASGIASASVSAYALAQAPRLVALARQRHDTPGLGLVAALAVAVAAALALRGRPRH